MENDAVDITIPPDPANTSQSGLPQSNPHIHNYNVDKGNGSFSCECGETVSIINKASATVAEEPPTKAPPVPGAGRPCLYCQNKEKVQQIVDDYIKKHQNFGEKATIPFIEELAMILGKADTRINDWVIKKTSTGEPEHPEFVESISILKNIQKLRLLQRTLGRYNPTGAIFQLKANHGLMESEKRVIAGDSNEPLVVEIVNEDRKAYDNE